VLTISNIGCGLGEVNILDSEKSVPVGEAVMPIFVLNHLPESSIKSLSLPTVIILTGISNIELSIYL